MSSSSIPVFYLHTAPEVLAIPEPVNNSGSIEPHSAKITLITLPTLEESPSWKHAVVTLMIAGSILQSKVVSSGDIIRYTSSLYAELPSAIETGVIYVPDGGNSLDSRRIDILRRLNFPDFEVIGITGDTDIPSSATNRKTVRINDNEILRFPVREIVRIFSSVFFSANTVIAQSIATFTNFGTGASTALISLPQEAHITLPIAIAAPPQLQAAAANPLLDAVPIQAAAPWQAPIKMSEASWTVFGVLSGVMLISFFVSVGLAYSWYIAHYF